MAPPCLDWPTAITRMPLHQPTRPGRHAEANAGCFATSLPGRSHAAMPRLRRADCNAPGITRVRRGRGFGYEEEDGTKVDDPEALERIRELAIPPAWTDVWICPDPRGHIQATGQDDAGRKQYLYHRQWREHRDRQKFERMLDFARHLPPMRKRLGRDLALRGLQERRVLACTAKLLDLGFFRVGGERYADENESYGLATMRRRHLRIERGRAVFDFPAKGAKRQVQEIADPSVTPTLRALKRRGGGGVELFAYRAGREWRDVSSEAINEYLKALTGDDFTAKDFRTWNATVLASAALATQPDRPLSKTARKRVANEATKRVAEYLNNTPAVCRSAYIDPRVFDRFESGETIRPALKRISSDGGPESFADREAIERAVMRLLG
jgi:DNA topoisomerase I